MRYRHQPLPHVEEGSTDPYIRLLELHPGGREGRITCTLEQTRLSQAEPYAALSYSWGSAPKRKIYINPASSADPAEGRYLLVPASLIPYLYRTRAHRLFKDRARVLWIDSVCINQDDDEEKNAQVAHMRDIYMRAELTHVWLGVEAERSPDALAYINKLSRKLFFQFPSQQKRALSPEEEREKADLAKVNITIGDPALEAVFALLDRPYFERAWIVQEAVVSAAAHIIVGDNSQTWLTFVWAISYLIELNAWVFEFYPAKRVTLALGLIHTKRYWDGQVTVDWWKTLIRHRDARSGNPQDKVFAFWGLGCKEQFISLGVRPNYSESVEKTYWGLAFRAFERGQAKLLHVPRICIDEKDKRQGLRELMIPSWVPDWRNTDSTAYPLVDVEVGNLALSTPCKSSCDSDFLPAFQDMNLKTGLPEILVLTGYTIAQVTHITPRGWKLLVHPRRQTLRSQAKILQFNQDQIAEWESVYRVRNNRSRTYEPTQETYYDALYKVLIAGGLPEHKQPAAKGVYEAFESRQRFLRLITNIGLGGCLWIYVIVIFVERLLRLVYRYQNPEWKFRAIVGRMNNRKGARLIAKIEEELRGGDKQERAMEYLALVPTQTEPGDEVVLCQGVKLPMVLRRKVPKQGIQDIVYEFVGGAYVHGAMAGELWRKERCEKILIN